MGTYDMAKKPRWSAWKPPNVQGAYHRLQRKHQAKMDEAARRRANTTDGHGDTPRTVLRAASPYVDRLCAAVDTTPFDCERCGRVFVGGGELCRRCMRSLKDGGARWVYHRELWREGRGLGQPSA